MHVSSAVLLALVVGAAGAFGGYTYARRTEAPPAAAAPAPPPPPPPACPSAPPPVEYSWSADKVSAEIAEARVMQPGLERTKRLFEVVRRVAPKEERIVIERLPLQTNDGVASLVRDRLLDRWAMEDPQAAMAYAQRLSDPADRDRASLVAARTWMEIDPEAAAAQIGKVLAGKSVNEAKQWVSELPAGNVRSSAQTQLAQSIAPSRPNEALGLVRAMSPGPARGNAAAEVLTILRRTGNEDTADEWLEESPLSAEERKVMNQRISALAGKR